MTTLTSRVNYYYPHKGMGAEIEEEIETSFLVIPHQGEVPHKKYSNHLIKPAKHGEASSLVLCTGEGCVHCKQYELFISGVTPRIEEIKADLDLQEHQKRDLIMEILKTEPVTKARDTHEILAYDLSSSTWKLFMMAEGTLRKFKEAVWGSDVASLEIAEPFVFKVEYGTGRIMDVRRNEKFYRLTSSTFFSREVITSLSLLASKKLRREQGKILTTLHGEGWGRLYEKY